MPHVFASILIAMFLFQDPSLDSPSPKERQAAIEKMAVIGNVAAIPALAEAYKKEPKSDIRAEILAVLARIRDKAAIPPIAEALHSDLDKEVRLQAIDSLLRLYTPVEDNSTIQTIFNMVKGAFVLPERVTVGPEVDIDASAKAALAESMQKDFSDDVRVQAVRALGSLRAKDQVPTLIATLEDPKNREHEEVRLEIIETLGSIRDASAGPSLEKALRDKDRKIVAAAATALGLVGYKEARPAVEALFRSSNDRIVKERALEGMTLMRDPGSAALFESLLAHRDDYYRQLAAEGLARLHHDPALLQDRLAQEKKITVRDALEFALAASGQINYINDLANELDSPGESQVHVYLVELGKYEGKLPELYRYFGSASAKVRAKMVDVVGDVGDPAARDQIQPLTKDPNIEVVRAAVAAIRKLGSK